MNLDRGLIEGEIWEVVYNGYYAVSSHGRVMSTYHRKSHSHLPVGYIMSISLKPKGYTQLNIRSDSFSGLVMVHNLVAASFIGDRPKGMQVNHKDGNKQNNHYKNLEYASNKKNMHHALDSGLIKLKISNEAVDQIRSDARSGMKQRDIAKKHGCSQAQVNGILLGKVRVNKWSKDRLPDEAD